MRGREWWLGQEKVLFGFMVHNREILTNILSSVSEQEVLDNFLDHMAVIMYGLRQFMEQERDTEREGKLPLAAQHLIPFLLPSGAFPSLQQMPNINEEVIAWAKEVFAEPAEVFNGESLSWGRKLASQFILDYGITPKLRELAKSNVSPEKLKEQLTDLRELITGTVTEREPVVVQPIKVELISGLKVTPTGLVIWDLIFKGLRHSETYLIVGPTGAGKSALAMMVGMLTAANPEAKKVVLFITFEMKALIDCDPNVEGAGLRSEFAIRAAGILGGVSRDLIDPVLNSADQVKTFESLDPTVQKTITDAFEWANNACQNFYVADFTDAAPIHSTYSAVTDRIREFKKEHGQLDLVIIDPFWPMLERTCAVMGITDQYGIRSKGLQMMSQLTEHFAKELKIPLVLTHQLGASGAKSGNPTVYDTAEIRTLCQNIENVLLMTTPTQGEALFIRGKARHSGEVNVSFPVVFDGARSRFEKSKKLQVQTKAARSADQLIQSKPTFDEAIPKLVEIMTMKEEEPK